jgi:hypothetical protein
MTCKSARLSRVLKKPYTFAILGVQTAGLSVTCYKPVSYSIVESAQYNLAHNPTICSLRRGIPGLA